MAINPAFTVQEYEKIMTAVGQVAVEIGVLELSARMLLINLVGKPSIYDALLSRLSFSARLDSLRELAATEIADQALAERVREFASRCRSLNTRRNEIVHSVYLLESDTGQFERIFRGRPQPAKVEEIEGLYHEIADTFAASLQIIDDVSRALDRSYTSATLFEFSPS